MNSIGNILANFEWTYEGPISIIRGTGYQGKGVSRTLFLNEPKLEDIPEQLFAVKLSQSTNPAKAGKGRFTNVQCSDGLFAIYDETKPEFQSDDPTKSGDAPYYIKSDAVIQVKLKGAVSQGNEYQQSTLSTPATAAETFQNRQVGSVWSPDGSTPAAPVMNTPEAPQAGQPVW